jgi:bacteriorhodopsin
MSLASQIKLTNSLTMGLFSVLLVLHGESPALVAIPGISSLKYAYIYNNQDADKQKSHYLSWFLTTPIMLWLIFSLNKLPLDKSVILLALNQLMIASGYFAATATTDTTVWRWFWIGCLAFIPIIVQLLRFSNALPLIILTLITWSVYPVVWYLSKKNLITDDTRDISYSILDFTSKVGIVLLYLVEVGKLKIPRGF